MTKETMKTEEIIKIIEESFLTEDDYFNTKIFYFMAGRFPDLAISHCMDIIEQIREKTIEKIKEN